MLRGDSFRGLSWSIKPYYTPKGGTRTRGKDPFTCTSSAIKIQKATVKAFRDNIFRPWEKQGFQVDVFLSGYGCTGLYHLTDAARIQKIHTDLIAWFNVGKARVKGSKFIQRRPGQTQDVGTQAAMRLLLDNAPLSYHSVVLWRYDLLPLEPMDSSNAVSRGNPHWANFAERSGGGYFQFNDDWAYSVPGWYAPCLIGVFLHDCMNVELHCKDGLLSNLPGPLFRERILPTHLYELYRSDFDQRGHNTDRKLCKFLEKRGGPSCYATPAEALKAACAALKAVPGLWRPGPLTVKPPIKMPAGFQCYLGWK